MNGAQFIFQMSSSTSFSASKISRVILLSSIMVFDDPESIKGAPYFQTQN